MNKLKHFASVQFGADPEAFLSCAGEIVGSERYVPESGLKTYSYCPTVQDGVQVEFHPQQSCCRAGMVNTLTRGMQVLDKHLKSYADLSISFEEVINISRAEWGRLSASSKLLGCTPSLNAYNHAPIQAPELMRMRCAGGHLHFGLLGDAAFRNLPITVKLLDAIVGNTCVLLNQHPRSRERRKFYGRAGEYRVPKHGLEYRTLSNFWLRSPVLFSMVMSFSRLALSIQFAGEWAIKELWARMDEEKCRVAINTNDPALALANFQGLKDFIKEYVIPMRPKPGYGEWALLPETLEDMDYFVERGLEHWFPFSSSLDSWLSLTEAHDGGWEVFLSTTVRAERQKSRALPCEAQHQPGWFNASTPYIKNPHRSLTDDIVNKRIATVHGPATNQAW